MKTRDRIYYTRNKNKQNTITNTNYQTNTLSSPDSSQYLYHFMSIFFSFPLKISHPYWSYLRKWYIFCVTFCRVFILDCTPCRLVWVYVKYKVKTNNSEIFQNENIRFKDFDNSFSVESLSLTIHCPVYWCAKLHKSTRLTNATNLTLFICPVPFSPIL